MASFFICHSPLDELPAGMTCGIYSTVYPRFFAEVYQARHFPLDGDVQLLGHNVLFFFDSAISGLTDYHVVIVKDNIDLADAEELSEALQQAVEWYADLLSDTLGEVPGNPHGLGLAGEYNPAMRGVRVFQPKHQRWYLVCHDTGVNCFEDVQDMLEFLVEFKGFSELDVVSEVINYEA